ncbi:GM17411 [Drosophila sechellia]|uniref:GM17411 n=1 Tax=Drosophila sechellia TaxID=7238 RepID=B4IM66_DROSE|nr:GM18773 [Drosophila sechellia]EDW44926.1 GM17411 [Drosophila sechellia]
MKHLRNVDSARVRDLLDALGKHHRVARSLDPITYVDYGIVIINDRAAKVQVDNSTR